jgi:hypothetical protein
VRNTYKILVEKSEGTIYLRDQDIDGIVLLLLVFLKKQDESSWPRIGFCAHDNEPSGVEGGEFLTQLHGRSTSREWLCLIQFNDWHRIRLISPRNSSHYFSCVRRKHVTLCTSTRHEVVWRMFSVLWIRCGISGNSSFVYRQDKMFLNECWRALMWSYFFMSVGYLWFAVIVAAQAYLSIVTLSNEGTTRLNGVAATHFVVVDGCSLFWVQLALHLFVLWKCHVMWNSLNYLCLSPTVKSSSGGGAGVRRCLGCACV